MTNSFENSNDFTRRHSGLRYGSVQTTTVHARAASGDASGMSRTPKYIKPVPFNGLLTNKLLTTLPGEDFARLLPYLEPVSLTCGENLYGFGEPHEHVYFPENAVISHLYTLGDGSTAEAVLIGKDGMVGLSAILATPEPTHLTQVLITGIALRMRREALKEEFARGGAMQRLLLAYAGARIGQLSQRAICNGRHTVDERLCSWLLMIHDRYGDDQLPLTHEKIASHLGARRAGITEAAIALRDREIITYSRGQIHIKDRAGLEQSACECYRTLSRQNPVPAQI
jgi:CRP-like cAMP-binding protein